MAKIIRLILAVCLVGFVHSEVLPSSGNPMEAANPNRNHQISSKLLCPDFAPGRTQVWNIEWQVKPPSGFKAEYSSYIELTQDEDGFLYVQGSMESEQQAKILKISGADGSYDPNWIYSAPFEATYLMPTHVKGHKMYINGNSMTTIVNTTSMTDIAVINHDSYTNGIVPPTYVPLGSDIMVSSAYNSDPDVPILRFLNTNTLKFDDRTNVNGAGAANVIAYKTNSGTEMPIVVFGEDPTPLTVWSPNYQFSIKGQNTYRDSYVQDKQLIIQYETYEPYTYTVAFYNADTGLFIKNITRNTINGKDLQSVDAAKVFGDKIIVVGEVDSTHHVFEFINESVIMFDRPGSYTPLYSILDKSVLLLTQNTNTVNYVFEFTSVDLDTQTINAVGSFPTDASVGFGNGLLSPPLVGDDCTIYSYFDDNDKYPGSLYAFKPLPISNVVPIVECITADGLGFFRSNNLEDRRIIIPHTMDRNNLEPLNIAPATDFRTNNGDRHFPFSSYTTLDVNVTLYNWRLEDYVLSFNNTAQVRCPEYVHIILYFNATNGVPEGFAEWMRQTYLDITHLSDWRVTLLPNTTNTNVAADAQVELLIAPANSSIEFTAERSAIHLAEYYYKLVIALNKNYPGSGLELIDYNGLPQNTEIAGSPIAVPMPPQSSPVTTPTNQNTTPKNSPVSSGQVLGVSLKAIVCFVLANLFMWQ